MTTMRRRRTRGIRTDDNCGLRIADCGLRRGSMRALREPPVIIPNPQSAIRNAVWLVLPLLGCNPASTRPAFLPYPQALTGIVSATNERVVPELNAWLNGEGLRVEWTSVQDGYVESAWYNTTTRQ